MATTEPIRDLEKGKLMVKYLEEKDLKYATLFRVGVNVVLRISDLLTLRWADILMKDKKTFKVWRLTEMKTGKKRVIQLTEDSIEALTRYMNHLGDINLEDFVFASDEKNDKPISEKRFFEILNGILKTKKLGEKRVNINNIKKLKEHENLYIIYSKLNRKNQACYIALYMLLNTDMELSGILQLTPAEVDEKNIEDQELLKLLRKLMTGVTDEDYIFKEYKGKTKPILRQTVHAVFNECAEKAGMTENIGTHSLRKTWVWNSWRNGESPATIMAVTNHSDWDVVKTYAGIRQEEINQTYSRNSLKF